MYYRRAELDVTASVQFLFWAGWHARRPPSSPVRSSIRPRRIDGPTGHASESAARIGLGGPW